VLKHLVILPDGVSRSFFFLLNEKKHLSSIIPAAAAILKMLEGVSKTTPKQNFTASKRLQFEWCCVK